MTPFYLKKTIQPSARPPVVTPIRERTSTSVLLVFSSIYLISFSLFFFDNRVRTVNVCIPNNPSDGCVTRQIRFPTHQNNKHFLPRALSMFWVKNNSLKWCVLLKLLIYLVNTNNNNNKTNVFFKSD